MRSYIRDSSCQFQNQYWTNIEMFNCVSAEQTVAMGKTKFLKSVSNSSNMLCQTFAAEAAKKLATL